VLGILITGLFISLMAGCALSNPVPFPAIEMPYEYIHATISLENEELIANVTGIYTFHNLENENVTMRYPVPPDSTVTYVKIGDNLLNWWFTNEKYQTFMGNFTMIEWFIEPVPETFNVTAHYYHPLHLLSPQTFSGEYAFLYAMGTGRLLANWYKQTTAYVTIRLSKDIVQSDKISLETVERADSEWILKPANFTLVSEDETWVVMSTFQSEYFQPLKEDLLLTFIEGIPPQVSNPTQNPAGNVQLNQPVNVTVTVTDIGIGVYNVTLYYTIDNGASWIPIPMDRVSSQTYKATIPGFTKETYVSYKIVAYDYVGNKAENNNNNCYYTYQVAQEYTTIAIILTTVMLSTILAILIAKRKTRK
jgi:hypothetical protein